MDVTLTDVWTRPESRRFFRSVWPMYVHEISGFDTDFYTLDDQGRWQPDLVDDWTSSVTGVANLREPRSALDPGQPFQRAHVVLCEARPVGFVCVGVAPFRYMPEGVDFTIAEFFVIHACRGAGVAGRALDLVLRRYPGRWCLQAIHDNARAIGFWRRALSRPGVHDLEERVEDGDRAWRFVVRG